MKEIKRRRQLEFLEKLIDLIQIEYGRINELWEKSENYRKINLKKSQVKNIGKEGIFNILFDYRDYINNNIVNFSLNIQQENLGEVKISSRVKSQNSIEYKLYNYQMHHEAGNIPINKCINDIYGIRMITKEALQYPEIKGKIEHRYKNLKCIDSSKGDYKAIHIYFKKDNYSFPWELQIWNKEDERNNLESHKKYKQDYTKWENESKGGK